MGKQPEYFGTLKIDFVIYDVGRSFGHDHFDWEKNQTPALRNCVRSLKKMLDGVDGILYKTSAYYHRPGSEEEGSCNPSQTFHILFDILSFAEGVRYQNLFEAIARLTGNSLVSFHAQLLPYDPKARYRLDFQS